MLGIIKNRCFITLDNLTVCLTIRASDVNPWVIERLSLLLNYYDPSPKFQVIDYGSEPEYAEKIKKICLSSEADYIYENDKGVFALARSRNLAFQYAKTEFLIFSDVDFIGERSLFQKIVDLGRILGFHSEVRGVLPFPIYHLSEKTTEEFFSFKDYQRQSDLLIKSAYLGSISRKNTVFEFVAPYSNFFLITKTCFSYTGGYCDNFRGHGSEDFEFFIRLFLLNTQLPVPENLSKDFYGPYKPTFYSNQGYHGFRKFIEAGTIPAELSGLKVFHLYHNKPRNSGYWTDENDWKRDKFNSILSIYYPNITNILKIDYLKRTKKALCLFRLPETYGYFVPLRLFGYELETFDGNVDQLAEITQRLGNREFDRVVIFNPYMKSHAVFSTIVALAKALSIRLTVIERGGLPNSIYYADEVVYGDPEYHHFEKGSFDDHIENREEINHYLNQIRSGSFFLENQEDYQTTYAKNLILRTSKLVKVFIPLQLHDDMAVTRFTEGYTQYEEFQNSIEAAAEANKDVLFVIKKHPLSRLPLVFQKTLENVYVAEENANIHSLIDDVDLVCVYNSGVGLLSCIHQKPTFNIGNSYYSGKDFLSYQVHSIQEALSLYKKGNFHKIDDEEIIGYLSWLLNEKYSFFTAKSIIKEVNGRRIHHYDSIAVQSIVLDGKRIDCNQLDFEYEFSRESYLSHRIDFNNFNSKTVQSKQQSPRDQKKSISKTPDTKTDHTLSKSLSNGILYLILDSKKYHKLQKDPVMFFKDSKSDFIKKFKGVYVK